MPPICKSTLVENGHAWRGKRAGYELDRDAGVKARESVDVGVRTMSSSSAALLARLRDQASFESRPR